MVQRGDIVVVGAGAFKPEGVILRELRGGLWQRVDRRFLIVTVLSAAVHAGIIYVLGTRSVAERETAAIESVPERFARLIVEKPISEVKKAAQAKTAREEAEVKPEDAKESTAEEAREEAPVSRKVAKKRVAARAAEVEQKVRAVGALGMLTGAGGKGPAVVDVLGKAAQSSGKVKDFEDALKDMAGLEKVKSADVLDRKLVKTKELTAARHREDIGDLVASIGGPQTETLAKKGSFIVRRPESIEGAASANTKRDDKAIGKVVTANKVSIRMSYEKYLKRNPQLEGKVTVRFTIDASGKVIRVEILENTTGSDDLAYDIRRKVRMWRFEQIPEGEVSVTYPFIFRPS